MVLLQRQRLATIAILLCGAIGMLLALKKDTTNTTWTTNNHEKMPPFHRNLASTPAECEQECKEPPLKDLQHFDGDDLLKPDQFLSRLKKQRSVWINNQLKKDYGSDNYSNMFEPKEGGQSVSVGRNRVFKDVMAMAVTKQPEKEERDETADEGWKRLVRKMKMKVLQIQLGILEERQNAKAICLDECSQEEEDSGRLLKVVAPSTGLYSKFTWATGGHSASAGHGNLFRESYTANMERALLPLFNSIGLEFEARNYAMGGTSSADEVALCFNQIFGRDIDFISWDYGMTDGHDLWRIALYAYKAAGVSRIANSYSMPNKIPHRPAFFGIHSNGRNLVIEKMHQLGMTALAMNEPYFRQVVLEAVPDMMGMKDQQIERVPPYLRYLKCNGKIESGEPGCQANKFNNTICENRKAKTSWHPGWKYHALVGNMMAVTLLDAMEDALAELVAVNAEAGVPDDESIDVAKKRLSDQLRALDGEEKQAYNNIFSSPLPEELGPHIAKWFGGGEKLKHLEDMDVETFYKEPSFCHSGILPSQARFQGILTENGRKRGGILDQNYEEGISSSALSIENPRERSKAEPYLSGGAGDQILLVRADGERQHCPEHLNLDYKDYFYVSNVEGWRTITLPNDSEKKAYTEFNAQKSKGHILVCLSGCDWGNCPKGDLHYFFGWEEPKPRKGKEPLTPEQRAKIPKVEITVNGEKVTEASNMDKCLALKNKNGHVFKANADGKYEIKMKVGDAEEYWYLRMSSFILV